MFFCASLQVSEEYSSLGLFKIVFLKRLDCFIEENVKLVNGSRGSKKHKFPVKKQLGKICWLFPFSFSLPIFSLWLSGGVVSWQLVCPAN